jgi:hypothetical protein
MEMKLKIIRELYGETEGETPPDRERERPSDLQKEAEAFRLTKAALDARPKQRPDARTVDAVVKAAAAALVDPDTITGNMHDRGRRRDRAPLARQSLHLRSAGVATAVVILIIGLMSVWQADLLVPEPRAHGDEQVASAESELKSPQSESAPVNKESTATGTRPSPSAALSPERNRREFASAIRADGGDSAEAELGIASYAAAPAPGTDDQTSAETTLSWDDGLTWDHGGDIMKVSQDIEMIRGGVELDWDPPSVPLEMIPVSGQDGDQPSHFLPAGGQRIP